MEIFGLKAILQLKSIKCDTLTREHQEARARLNKKMIIKTADNKDLDLGTIRGLRLHPHATPEKVDQMDAEIRHILSGRKGESDVAYELFHYFGSSEDWAIIHDVRLERAGRVAQIDHILINKWLDVFVCETKNFKVPVLINGLGEFTISTKNGPKGIPSPVAQNNRHIAVLKDVLDNEVPAPSRLALQLRPKLQGLVVFGKGSSITRPDPMPQNAQGICKADNLPAELKKASAKGALARVFSPKATPNELRDYAEKIAAQHTPLLVSWFDKFALNEAPKKVEQGAAIDYQASDAQQPDWPPSTTPAAGVCTTTQGPRDKTQDGQEVPTQEEQAKPVLSNDHKVRAAARTLARAAMAKANKSAIASGQEKSGITLHCGTCANEITSGIFSYCKNNPERFANKIMCIPCQEKHVAAKTKTEEQAQPSHLENTPHRRS